MQPHTFTAVYSFGGVGELIGSKAPDNQYVSGVYEVRKTHHDQHRGRALIINIIQCSCDSSNDADSNDARDMETLFKYLGYDVNKKDVKKNNITNGILQILQSDIAPYDHSEYDSFICCILPFKCKNHHQSDGFFKYDGKAFNTNGITENLSGATCPSLKGKPKIFFIQASRETKEREAIALEVIPNITDFAFCYQTPEDIPAYGSPDGTIFVQEICRAFTQYAKFVPFMDIMTRVHKVVGEKAGGNVPNVSPETTSSLRKNFYFF